MTCILFLAIQGQAQYTPKEKAFCPEFAPCTAGSLNTGRAFGQEPASCLPGFLPSAESGIRTGFGLTLPDERNGALASLDFSAPGGFSYANEFFSSDDLFAPRNLFSDDVSAFFKKAEGDSLFEASPGIDPKLLTFKQRNSGAFKRKKKGGLKSPGMAALCSAVVPGLGQIYNGQWYKTPVIYAGAAVLVYFTDDMLRNRNLYQAEIRARTDSASTGFNPELADYSLDEILELRNYYEHNFELCFIIAGAVYLLNIIDAIVYAHLSSFNVSPDLSMSVKPYARTNFHIRNGFPLDAGIRVCLTLK